MKKEYYTNEYLSGIAEPNKEPAMIEFLKESNAIEGIYDNPSLEQAILAWEYLMNEDVLTVSVILKTHKILMNNQRLQSNHKGYFRDCNVRVGNWVAMTHHMVGPSMQQWCFEAMRAYPAIDPIALHIQYEKIHPFVDGNGRTGRMFMNWMFMKRFNVPTILVISEQDKKEYYQWFK